MKLIPMPETNEPVIVLGSMIAINGTNYRVLAIENEIVSMINMDLNRFSIIEMNAADIEWLFEKGKAFNLTDTDFPLTPALEEGTKAQIDFRYRLIGEFVSDLYPDYRSLQARGGSVENKPIAGLARRLGLSVKTTLKYVRKYLQSGGDYMSLLDNRNLPKPLRVYVEPDVRNHENALVRAGKRNVLHMQYEDAYSHYLSGLTTYKTGDKDKPTLLGAYIYFRIKYYTYKDENGKTVQLPDEQIPSYWSFYRWVTRHKLNGGLIRDHAVGNKDRFNSRRMLTGIASYGLSHPAEVVEIDEQELKAVMVTIDENGIRKVVGKPIVHIAIDVKTQAVVGMSVTLDANNAYIGVLDLFDSMMMTDEEFAIICGIDPRTVAGRTKPGPMIPDEIRVDHGAEYTSKALKKNLTGGDTRFTLEGKPIDINLAPPATGSMKGDVEGYFKYLENMIHNLLGSGYGYVKGTSGDMSHYRSAVLDIETFTKLAYECMHYWNNRSLANYPITPEIDLACPNRTPLEIWDHLTSIYGAGMDVSDEEARRRVRYGFMIKSKELTISRKQLGYRSFLYYDVEDDLELLREIASFGDKGQHPVDVRYDPRSINKVYRLGSDGKVYVYGLAKKRDNLREYAHMSWKEIDKVISNNESVKYSQRVSNIKGATGTQIKMIEHAGEKLALSGKSDSKDIRGNAAAEIMAQREKTNAIRDAIFNDPFLPSLQELPVQKEEAPEEPADFEIYYDDDDIAAFVKVKR